MGPMFDDIPEREAEVLNIEYEKLLDELETMPEYLKEKEEENQKWVQENEELNTCVNFIFHFHFLSPDFFFLGSVFFFPFLSPGARSF